MFLGLILNLVIIAASATCPICLADLRRPALSDKPLHESGHLVSEFPAQTLTCTQGHTFHQECFAWWKKKDQSCPICRYPVNDHPSNQISAPRDLGQAGRRFRVPLDWIRVAILIAQLQSHMSFSASSITLPEREQAFMLQTILSGLVLSLGALSHPTPDLASCVSLAGMTHALFRFKLVAVNVTMLIAGFVLLREKISMMGRKS